MMRAAPLFLALLLGISVGVGSLVAQTTSVPVDTTSSNGSFWDNRFWSALGGAVLGAGVGYFASQLVRSDWDEIPGQSQANRPAWATVGGSLGLAVGFSFPLSFGGGAAIPAPRAIESRYLITAEQIHGAVVATAYEAVRLFRPEWLVKRLPDIIGQSSSETMRVYLDDFLFGGIDSLREVNALTIEAIRFVPTSVATARWGVGHSYGAIQVLTR
jgi:hypothetical protein